MFTIDELNQAYANVRKVVQPTPLIYSEWLSEIVGTEVWMKLEVLNQGKSFKIRGATNALLSLAEKPEEVVTASGGNHGLALAIAANKLGIKSTIFLPTSTSRQRLNLFQKFNSKIELVGDSWDDSNVAAMKYSDENQIPYIHPFADPHVFLGQGTIVREIMEQNQNVDTIFASVGGGGLLGGMAITAEIMGLEIDFYSVETVGADSYHQSRIKGHLVELEKITSIATTLGARKTTQQIFEILQRNVKESFVVSDEHAVKEMRGFLDIEKLLIEPAASCVLSALIEHRHLVQGREICIVVCGGNISLNELLAWENQFNIHFSTSTA